MSNPIEELKVEIASYLRTAGVRPEAYQTGIGKTTDRNADFFKCRWVKDNEDYGDFYISLDNNSNLKVYETTQVASSPNFVKDGSLPWKKFIVALRNKFQRKLRFELSSDDELGPDMQERAHFKKLEESYHSMGRQKSYNDNIPECKMIIKHSRALEEGEQRYRNIEKIFIENAIGERALVPTNKPGLARTFARHIAEGGKPNDERWNHIASLCEEYSKMAGFVRATRNNQFNESAQRLVTEGINHYQKLRETLSKLRGKKGYNAYFESYTPALMEDEQSEDLSEMFMNSSLDPRIENVMPILNKLSKNISENKDLKEVQALEEWADKIAEGEWSGDVGDVETEDHIDHSREPENHTQEENGMAASSLKSIAKKAERLYKLVKGMEGDTLEPWQQSKVTKADDYIDTVFDTVDADHDMYESDDNESEKIQHLMQKYGWSRQEALEHLHYGEHSDEDFKGMTEAAKRGLWANIHAKRERIKHGSGEHMRKPGSKGAPTADALKKSATESVAEGSEHNVGGISHSIIKHPGGKHQVVVKHGDKVAHTSLHNSEEDAKKSLASQVAYSKKMLKVDEQGVAEGSSTPAGRDGDYLTAMEKAKKISTVIQKKEQNHPFDGKLVSEDTNSLAHIKKLSGL